MTEATETEEVLFKLTVYKNGAVYYDGKEPKSAKAVPQTLRLIADALDDGDLDLGFDSKGKHD